jgi:hypothetical protein
LLSHLLDLIVLALELMLEHNHLSAEALMFSGIEWRRLYRGRPHRDHS